ncbi:tyrosine-type recombinase/integrase [Paeniglutamicibacter gangotriensis]|uniref:Site-specific tyrosine recombinase n=1 Tax=Paeniglutamicibacter gangotriensis Lz1y TaxID=1276920 RepID=M7NFS3_9MICC|nr:tyrosine-type recombinase/integrase [Paeniglutamicibacter gangotriensis]EMQ97338.1 site-specific tyrosine recombinase [Paeniglutamicibacter gangotriensis Lz1y]
MKSDEFFALVRSWLTSYLPRSRRLSPHTIRSYKTALTTLLAFLGETRSLKLQQVGFDAITYSSMSEFISWLMDVRKLSASSANQRVAAIKSFLSYCAGEEPALVAIWLDVKRVRPARAPERVPNALSMPAVEALIRAPGQQTRHGLRDTLLILLMFDAAARIQEILDLRPTDIVTNAGSSAVTLTGKGHKTRTVPIMDKTGRHVEQYLKLFHPNSIAPDASLFYTVWAGEPHQMSQDNVAYMLNKYAAIAQAQCPEVPEHVNAHQLRHARAMQMLRAGVPLPHIKEFLGHANISTTEIYASADNQMVREAIQKAASSTPDPAPIWKGPDELILRLAGLK